MEPTLRDGSTARLAKELDEQVTESRERPLGTYPYVWLDATFPKVREVRRVREMALMIAIGVTDQGERHMFDLAIGASENSADWLTSRHFYTYLTDFGPSDQVSANRSTSPCQQLQPQPCSPQSQASLDVFMYPCAHEFSHRHKAVALTS